MMPLSYSFVQALLPMESSKMLPKIVQIYILIVNVT